MRSRVFVRRIIGLTGVLFTGCLFGFAAGVVDPSFNAAVTKVSTAPVPRGQISAVQTDGKVICYGVFYSVGGLPATNIVRVNIDGTRDTTFNAAAIPGVANVGDIKLQSTGKAIIVGSFGRGIIRLNADGSIDPGFVLPNGFVASLSDVEVMPDDRLVIGGPGSLYRLLPDGAVDPTFTGSTPSSLWKFALQADGKIVAATSAGVLSRYNADGTNDATFTTSVYNSTVWDVAVQPDGKILVAGVFTMVNGFPRNHIFRVNTDGTGDASFSSPLTTAGYVLKLIPLADGKTLIGGRGLSNPSQSGNINTWRLNADGTTDLAFIETLPIEVFDLDLMSDGRVLLSGQAAFSNTPTQGLYRFNANGPVDNSFKAIFGDAGEARKAFVQSNGKILVGGKFSYAIDSTRPGLARFNQDGTVDPGFNPTFSSSDGDFVDAIDVQADGKVIVGFTASDALRLNPDGASDIVFQQTPGATDVKVLANGKILIAGTNYIKQFNSDGSVDAGFNATITGGVVQKFAIQSDGKIVIVGSFTGVGGTPRGRVARLNADGSLDGSFGTADGANAQVFDVAIQSNGQILIGGSFSGVNLTNRPKLARLNLNGSLDIGFLPNLSGDVYAIRVQPDSRIVVGGFFATINNVSRPGLARLDQGGNLDPSLDPGNGDVGIRSFDFQPDGKIVIAGQFRSFGGSLHYGIARLLNSLTSSAFFDYDGDRKADVSVFRPSTNRWYVFKSSDATVSEATFGLAGDVAAPADYDGDGKTDLAIYRPGSGDWWYLSSINGAQVNVHWGASGDVPRPSDFDGDGKADYVVFRPSNSVWYRFGSTGAVSITSFGLAGDKPVTGDFDGDGKSDVAIFRPSTGDWWYQSSINGAQLATHWGATTDVPAAADYDGDGRTDIAVYRPSNGTWYILNSSTSQATILNFGISEDKPVAGDYDGDGKADIAVFRPSTGVWYMQRSTAGFSAVGFGISTDVPTESAFVP